MKKTIALYNKTTTLVSFSVQSVP